MTRPEMAMLALGALFFAIGALAWAIRNWPRDDTDEEFWP